MGSGEGDSTASMYGEVGIDRAYSVSFPLVRKSIGQELPDSELGYSPQIYATHFNFDHNIMRKEARFGHDAGGYSFITYDQKNAKLPFARVKSNFNNVVHVMWGGTSISWPMSSKKIMPAFLAGASLGVVGCAIGVKAGGLMQERMTGCDTGSSIGERLGIQGAGMLMGKTIYADAGHIISVRTQHRNASNTFITKNNPTKLWNDGSRNGRVELRIEFVKVMEEEKIKFPNKQIEKWLKNVSQEVFAWLDTRKWHKAIFSF